MSDEELSTDDMAELNAEVEREMAEQREAVARMGWYEWAGGLRYHDGINWTDHLAPPNAKVRSLGFGEVVMATAIGAFLAIAVVWGLAQAEPDTFYFPVKFVVDELPQGPL